MRTLLVAILAFASQAQKEPRPPQDVPPVGKAPILIYEDFDTTAPGKVPSGWQKQGEVAVAADQAHSGRQSLRIEAAVNGPRRITTKSDALKALGGTHWGRLFFKVQQPSPVPASGVIHSTLVAGSATSPLAQDPIEVRPLDTVMNAEGMYQYIYNVQPQKRPEFGKGSSYKYKFSDSWTLAEWFVDHATQTYRLFINGEEIKDIAFMKGAGQFKDSEIPAVFESLSFGWNNYQQAGKGFVAWIDDIALSKERLGIRGIPVTKKK
jgi:hypothetical protein